MTETSTSSTTSPSTNVKFSHAFSGLSVWLEPDSTQTSLLTEEMEFLMHKCGGVDAGMHRFVPHCTLLYNTSFPLENHQDFTQNTRRLSQLQVGGELLTKCLAEYSKHANIRSSIQLTPTSHYYFPYPKTADNGKGFGCAISLLILETTSELQLLHEVVKKIFPPDERHRSSTTAVTSNSCCENESHVHELESGSIQTAAAYKEPSFRPHMALIYAPENHDNVTNGWLENYTCQMESEKRYLHWTPNESHNNADKKEKANDVSASSSWNAKYLSIWSTEGTLDEWYPIVKLDLSPETCR